MKIVNKNYSIESSLNKNIVLISDLHYKNKKDMNTLNKILDNIKNISPDFICIPGDITDRSRIDDEDLFISWLKELSIVAKTFISIGNHEFYGNKRHETTDLNKKFYDKLSKISNLYVLNNENKVIDNINFIGITIPIEYYNTRHLNNFSNLLDKIKVDDIRYNILLCHSPIDICKKDILKDKNLDLVLCGHMHGGIVPRFLKPILKNRGFISPNRTLFPKNVYGNLKKYNTDVVITSGCKVLPYKFLNKLFSIEVVIIKLTNNKKNV